MSVRSFLQQKDEFILGYALGRIARNRRSVTQKETIMKILRRIEKSLQFVFHYRTFITEWVKLKLKDFYGVKGMLRAEDEWRIPLGLEELTEMYKFAMRSDIYEYVFAMKASVLMYYGLLRCIIAHHTPYVQFHQLASDPIKCLQTVI